MNDAFGDIRNATASAIFTRLTDPTERRRLLESGADFVDVQRHLQHRRLDEAGAHRIDPNPNGPNCAAIDRVMPSRPALDAQ